MIRSRVRSPRAAAIGTAELTRYLMLRARFPTLRGPLFFVHPGADIRIGPNANVRIGFPVHFMDDFTGHFFGRVHIGDNVFFNRGCYVSVHASLSIGQDCLFGEYVSIHDENHLVENSLRRVRDRPFTTQPISIGRNVWIGAKSTVLQGVTIGDGAVVGAHSVVTRDVPAGTLAVGVPARVLRAV